MISLISSNSGFSQKQRTALLWWKDYPEYDGIICDGAIRSGKTFSMGIGFMTWAMTLFDGGSFAVCGKTIASVRRNILVPIFDRLFSIGMKIEEKTSKNYIDVEFAGRKNRFYLFGGKDEGSAALIQGMTLSGVLLDEVVLMPRSFVEQAVARCSVKGSKIWFDCNPEHPRHWFRTEWIMKRKQKNLLYLHFEMKDNPSLTEKILDRYKKLYSGAFYERFVLGKWTAPTGLVYPMFSEKLIFDKPPECTRYIVSADYGTVNPASFGLWGYSDGKWYRLREYYYSSRETGLLRTDEEHYAALENLCHGTDVEFITADPSAASFIECIRRHGKFRVKPAENNVLNGIRRVGSALSQGKLMFSSSCTSAIKEFSLYVWDEKSGGDVPLKENDHAMDDIRYFVNTVTTEQGNDGFFVASMAR